MFKARGILETVALCAASVMFAGCPQAGTPSVGSLASTSSTAATTTTSLTSSVNALQIITKADSTGSFDSVIVPAAGGAAVKAQRIYDGLSGGLITTTNLPTWFTEARVFLTSTRTSAGSPTYTGSNTPCGYFDSYSDNNPDSAGFYTIDGYNAVSGTAVTSDIDQCAGTAAAEQNQLGAYIKIDRRFMNSTDKMQIIVKAKLIDEPNTAPTTSSCVVGGYFDATACSTAVFSISMRTAPGASAQPFYMLFPSAKANDLLSESILLPIHLNTGITTISIDRAKGGFVLYGITVVRL